MAIKKPKLIGGGKTPIQDMSWKGPMPAVMPVTEIQKRLKKLEKSSSGGGPLVTNVGDNTYEWTEEYTWIAYASDINNASSQGAITSQSDAVDFSFSAISDAGVALSWIGYWTSKSLQQSGDPTDYIWADLDADVPASSISLYYTESTNLLPVIGNPTYPGAGITWTSFTGSAPASAFWVATQYTINGTKTPWRVIPVKTKIAAFGLIIYTISGRNKPTLNDSQWKADAIAAVSSFTGHTYSTTNEMGFGTTIVITYDNGKLYGQLKNVSNVPTWVAPVDYIDGDLLVNSTIITEKIADNAINTAKILNDAIDATKIADNAVATAALADGAVTATQIASDAITTPKIYAGAITAAKIGAGEVTATKINAGTIGADHIVANSLTAGQIATNAITATEINAGAVTAAKIDTDAVTANAVAANAIVADNIVSNAITTDKINSNAVTAAKVNLVPADVGAGTASGSNSMRINSSKIEIYNGGTLRVQLGDLS